MVIAISTKQLAVLSLTSKQKNFTRDSYNMTNIAPTHAGVNVLLGGAMMSCMLIVVVCICYLCHWRFQKIEERYGRCDSWIQVNDSDPPVHIFTLEQQCYDDSGLYRDGGGSFDHPPPGYDDVVGTSTKSESDENDPDLPSYETAMKLSANGYV